MWKALCNVARQLNIREVTTTENMRRTLTYTMALARLYNKKPPLCLCHYSGEISALLSAKNSSLLVHPSILIARPDSLNMLSYHPVTTQAGSLGI